MENATAKWFHTVCQLVEDKHMSMFLEIMYLVFKSLWILFGDHDLFYQEDMHNSIHLRHAKIQMENWKAKIKYKKEEWVRERYMH